jgi:hypothetical protein
VKTIIANKNLVKKVAPKEGKTIIGMVSVRCFDESCE